MQKFTIIGKLGALKTAHIQIKAENEISAMAQFDVIMNKGWELSLSSHLHLHYLMTTVEDNIHFCIDKATSYDEMFYTFRVRKAYLHPMKDLDKYPDTLPISMPETHEISFNLIEQVLYPVGVGKVYISDDCDGEHDRCYEGSGMGVRVRRHNGYGHEVAKSDALELANKLCIETYEKNGFEVEEIDIED